MYNSKKDSGLGIDLDNVEIAVVLKEEYRLEILDKEADLVSLFLC